MARQKRQVKRMADISKEIQDFREAVYGEEVRGSMISLAEKVNGEVEDNTDKVTKYGEAEQSRAEAETARVNAEKARVTAENGRVSAESDRASAESTRAENEEDRISAEEDRAEAETARVRAEDARVSAENARVTAESGRVSAESNRVSAESGRVTAEQGRVSAETGRANAESARETAETNRQTNTAQAIEDCDEAAARANAAAEAAEGLVIGDISQKTVTFETALERANIQSGDSLAVAFGKLAKFCTDLDPHAFAAPVNNLTGTDPSLPLAAPQGKALKEDVDALNSALEDKQDIYYTSIAPAGEAPFAANKNMLLLDIGNVNRVNNKSGYFTISNNDRSEWTGLSGKMPQSGIFMGFREVYAKQAIPGSEHIMLKITEMYPVCGRQYFNFYNYGSWVGWSVTNTDS